MRRLSILSVLCYFFLPALAMAANTGEGPHVKVALISENQAVRPGDAFTVGLRFQVEPHWHIYWQNPGDSGQPPSIKWTLPAGVGAENIVWPRPTRIDLPPLVNYGYEGEVVLPMPMHTGADTPTGKTLLLAGEVRWLVCAEICIPGKASLDLEVAVANEPAVDPQWQHTFELTQQQLPLPWPPAWRLRASGDEHPTLHVDLHDTILAAQFFPFQAEQLEQAAPQKFVAQPTGFELTLQRSEQAKHLTGLAGLLEVTTHKGTFAYTVDIPLEAPAPGSTTPLWSVLVLALAGGIILNLMPCVFPVLSLKVMSFLQSAHHDAKAARLHAAAYTMGILVSFWLLAGVLMVLRYTGEQIGWGFQLQSPRFVVAVASLIFALGLNLLGIFEIGGTWMGAGQSLAARGGLGGAFFTGILAVIVATPCTAPFMGSAVGYALGQDTPVAFAVFTALALGLALPYVVLSFIPHIGKILPRPGAWMVTLREAMAFPLFATVIWLVWVLGAESGLSAVAFLLVDFLLLGLGAWVIHRWNNHRLAWCAALLIGALGLGIGISQASDAAGHGQVQAQTPGDGALAWEPYSADTLARYRSSGRPIFVDFTAAWCLSCKVNERLVFSSSEVQQRLHALNMVLLKADWTNQDPTITQALAQFGRSGVPLYVIYSKDANAAPVQLPEVITAGIVLDALSKLQ